jgi:hypothetical protein
LVMNPSSRAEGRHGAKMRERYKKLLELSINHKTIDIM